MLFMGVQLCGRERDAATLAQIEAIVRANRSWSRRVLPRCVCERLDWRATNGRLKEINCPKALLELHRRGRRGLFPAGGPEPSADPWSEALEHRRALEKLGEINQASRIWSALKVGNCTSKTFPADQITWQGLFKHPVRVVSTVRLVMGNLAQFLVHSAARIGAHAWKLPGGHFVGVIVEARDSISDEDLLSIARLAAAADERPIRVTLPTH